MKNYVLAWMLFAQTVHAVSCLLWLGIVRHTLENNSYSIGHAPLAMTLISGIYPLVMVALSLAAWLRFARQEPEPAVVIITVLFVLSFPVTTYGVVNFLATR